MDFYAQAVFVMLTTVVGKILFDKYLKRSSFKHYHERDSYIQESLELLKDKLSCKSVFLVKNSNGGGLPEIGNTVYSSVIKSDSISKNIASKWMSVQIDSSYSYLMKELIDNPKYSTLTKFTDDLEDDSILKNHLISMGVQMIRFIRVYENKKSFYYLRIDYLNIPDLNDKEAQKDDIRQISTNIWRKLK